MNEPESDGIDPLYISDIETYDLLCINEPGRELFGVSSDEDIANFRCYEFLQYHDSLTGLLNRNRYIQDLDGLDERNQPIGVIFLDINGMKEVNDRDGHAVGDRLLIECANAMRSVLADLFSLYRIGGDELVAIAVGIAEDDFSRLSTELGRTFEDGSLCRAAIGARWEEHPESISEMLFDADEAMCCDKRTFYRAATRGSHGVGCDRVEGGRREEGFSVPLRRSDAVCFD
ncbi:GGDEF domain-containing protein [Raoultibacter timonensis]|uniref:GGDEF domain-containing protein n=1 Tax=Raoultibacter timonensis TaxID=1907662 RepID=UPI000C842D2C|nr:GGDEF domain-containing protein [Raoultibacter timonensis]